MTCTTAAFKRNNFNKSLLALPWLQVTKQDVCCVLNFIQDFWNEMQVWYQMKRCENIASEKLPPSSLQVFICPSQNFIFSQLSLCYNRCFIQVDSWGRETKLKSSPGLRNLRMPSKWEYICLFKKTQLEHIKNSWNIQILGVTLSTKLSGKLQLSAFHENFIALNFRLFFRSWKKFKVENIEE